MLSLLYFHRASLPRTRSSLAHSSFFESRYRRQRPPRVSILAVWLRRRRVPPIPAKLGSSLPPRNTREASGDVVEKSNGLLLPVRMRRAPLQTSLPQSLSKQQCCYDAARFCFHLEQ